MRWEQRAFDRSRQLRLLALLGGVLVGCGGKYTSLPSAAEDASTEIDDPSANACAAGQDLVVARWIHTTTRLPGGRVLVADGSSSAGAGSALASAELYDESTGEFFLTAPLAVARWSHTASLLPDGVTAARQHVLAGRRAGPHHRERGRRAFSSTKPALPGQAAAGWAR